MKRLASSVLAFVFLSTATLHLLSHAAFVEQECAVCCTQQNQAADPSAPRLVVVAAERVRIAEAPVPHAVTAHPCATVARAPPSFPA